MEVSVTSTVFKYRATGEIISVASSADPQTRTFQIEVMFDNAEGRFKPGMFVRVNLVLDKLEGVLLIPRRAVLILDDKPTVFVISDNRVRQKILSLGSEVDGRVVVTEGLTENDTLVTMGQDYLEDGNKVKITTWEE